MFSEDIVADVEENQESYTLETSKWQKLLYISWYDNANANLVSTIA